MNEERTKVSTVPPENYRYHFFVSYTTREDEVKLIKPFIDDYLDELRRRCFIRNLPIYYDGWEIRLGAKWVGFLDQELLQGLRDSAFTVSFLSPGYLTSSWCAFEWNTTEAIHAKRGLPAPDKSILPIVWKPISHYINGADALEVRYRKWLDISDKIGDIKRYGWTHSRNENYYDALKRSVETTIKYHRAWFPESKWFLC